MRIGLCLLLGLGSGFIIIHDLDLVSRYHFKVIINR